MNIELQQRLMTKATSLIELIEYMIKLLARLNIVRAIIHHPAVSRACFKRGEASAPTARKFTCW